jgi:D-cysteine desulfhydrase family pyridoxal phosphate-dependent enzyme
VTAPVRFACAPTPVEPLPRLTDALGGPVVWVKRDDLTGLALGGNKARKLERLVADALAHGCDVLVTGGGPQSNHVRQTAAAARRVGLDAHVVLGGRTHDAPGAPSGNVLLDVLLGARIETVADGAYDAIEQAIVGVARRLEADGRRPYAIPVGGASLPGVLAYADAAAELRAQLPGATHVVVADGSGGTHAGLLAGFGAGGPRVVGVDVGTRPALAGAVARMAAEAASACGAASMGSVVVDAEHVGAGYARLDDRTLAAVRLAARTEGMLLDPVYTGKAFAALVDWARDGRLTDRDTVVFWHTGGQPALFASRYATQLASS